MLCIAVVNLKGGSTKTTSAAYLLHALAESGLSVLGVDADPENCSLVRWSDLAEWATPVVGMPVKDLHRRLDAVSEGFDAVVIDTPPMESGREAQRVGSRLIRLDLESVYRKLGRPTPSDA